MPPSLGRADARRPYFEVLIVTGAPATRWPALAAEWRRLRRPLDAFVYEPVFVGSFEDAFCAAMLNPDLAAVIIHEGFPFRSRHDAPILRALVEVADQKESPEASALHLAQVLKRVRPELDLYLVSNGRVEEIAGSPEANALRRVFYAVEELLELHLAILEGVQERYETPFFDNLKKYAQRPIGTFHALPIARGKSIFKSDWIRDMGEFYGLNLFLAESSATTGGLDSLLEPTGNIKKAQEMAARAFGADHVFFVTNGTSTSNKMAVQALLAPGDIVIVDRNCHKSHHYGMVLARCAAALRRSVPDDGILDVRRRAAAHDQAGAAEPESGRQAAPRQDGGPDELHLRRPHLQHAPGDGRMPGDQAGPDLPVGRGLVRVCAILAVPAAAHRDGRGERHRGVAAGSEVGRRI